MSEDDGTAGTDVDGKREAECPEGGGDADDQDVAGIDAGVDAEDEDVATGASIATDINDVVRAPNRRGP